MSNSKIVKGYYGLWEREFTTFYHNGWYAVKGDLTAYYTDDDVDHKMDFEEIIDRDMMQSEKPFKSLRQLIKFVDGENS